MTIALPETTASDGGGISLLLQINLSALVRRNQMLRVLAKCVSQGVAESPHNESVAVCSTGTFKILEWKSLIFDEN